MRSISSNTPRSQFTFRRVRNAILAILALVLLALGIWTCCWWGWAKRAVKVELAKVEQAGEPVTFDELNLTYQLPPGVADATQHWNSASRMCAQPGLMEDANALPFVNMQGRYVPQPEEPTEFSSAAGLFLQKHGEALKRVHMAAEHGGAARYPIDADHWPKRENFQHLNGLREASWLLGVEARFRAEQGEDSQAIDSILAIVQIARSLNHEPSQLSQLVRCACLTVAVNTIEDLLAGCAISEFDMSRLQATLRTLKFDDAIYLSVLGERVYGIWAIQHPDSAELPDSARQIIKRFGDGKRDADLSYFLQLTARQIETTKQPWLQGRSEAHRIQGDISRTIRDSFVAKVRYTMSPFLVPLCHSLYDSIGRCTVRRDAADVAIGLELFRRRENRLPMNLAELVPQYLSAVPVDPFSDKPLMFVVHEGTPIVYSVGTDGVDDGGRCDNDFEPDIAFTLPRRDRVAP